MNNIASTHCPWHDDIWTILIKKKANNRLPHAILLSGLKGIGKNALALRLAKSLICLKPKQNPEDSAHEACLRCQSCTTFDARSNPDLLIVSLLNEKKQIGVDQIREVSLFLNYSRSYNTYRVVIIDDADSMTINAANSLLKSLEEPSDNTIILLISTRPTSLIATIKSRCHHLMLPTPSKSVALEWLEKQSTSTELKETNEVLLDYTQNRPLSVLSLDPQELEDRRHFFDDLKNLVHDKISLTEMAKKWETYNIDQLINWQIRYLQSKVKKVMTDNPKHVEDKSQEILTENQQGLTLYWNRYQQLIDLKQYTHTSVNTQMFLEKMLLLWK